MYTLFFEKKNHINILWFDDNFGENRSWGEPEEPENEEVKDTSKITAEYHKPISDETKRQLEKFKEENLSAPESRKVREKFAKNSVNWEGIVAMVQKEKQEGGGSTQDAVARLMQRFGHFRYVDNWNGDRSDTQGQDDKNLQALINAGYILQEGEAGSLETARNVMEGLARIQANPSKYLDKIEHTRTVDGSLLRVPRENEVQPILRKNNPSRADMRKIANYLANLNGDRVLSRTNRNIRDGFFIFGTRIASQGEPVDETYVAREIYDRYKNDPDGLWEALNVRSILGKNVPQTVGELKRIRETLGAQVAANDYNPASLVAPDTIRERITEDNRAIINALRKNNPNISEEDLVKVAGIVQASVTEGGLFFGLSPFQLGKHVKIGKDGVSFAVSASVGKKWIQQASEKIQTEEGIGAGVSLSKNGLSLGAGASAGIRFIMEDNGEYIVTNGNKTIGLRGTVGISPGGVGFGVEVPIYFNDMIGSLLSADSARRKFFESLFEAGSDGSIQLRKRLPGLPKGIDEEGIDQLNAMIAVLQRNLRGVQDGTERKRMVKQWIDNIAQYLNTKGYMKNAGVNFAGFALGASSAGGSLSAMFQDVQGYFQETARPYKSDEYVAERLSYSPESLLTTEEQGLIGNILSLEKLDTRIRDGRVNRYKRSQDIGELKGLFNDIYKKSPPLQKVDGLQNAIDQTQNINFVRQTIGAIINLTAGGDRTWKLAGRLEANPDQQARNSVNQYLSGRAGTAMARTINEAYGSGAISAQKLKEMMVFQEGESTRRFTFPQNSYAEGAYSKRYGKGVERGMLPLAPGATIIGEPKPIRNETIRTGMIAKIPLPQNLEGVMNKSQYHELMGRGSVTVDGKKYTAEKSELLLGRSGVSTDRTCFNAAFAITLPKVIKGDGQTVYNPYYAPKTTANEFTIGALWSSRERSRTPDDNSTKPGETEGPGDSYTQPGETGVGGGEYAIGWNS